MSILIQPYDRPVTVMPVEHGDGLAYLQQLLHSLGLRTMVTGDIRYAEINHEVCQCPYYTDGKCRCHEVILLVYGNEEPPLTLILECRGAWMCIYLCSTSITRLNQYTKQRVLDLLTPEEGAKDRQ